MQDKGRSEKEGSTQPVTQCQWHCQWHSASDITRDIGSGTIPSVAPPTVHLGANQPQQPWKRHRLLAVPRPAAAAAAAQVAQRRGSRPPRW